MIYIDNAATSFPKPRSVCKEMERCMKYYCGNPGRGSHDMSLAAAKKVYECRSIICDFFGSEYPENTVFCNNATMALNTAINALASPGKRVICSDAEHNSVLRPLYSLSGKSIKLDIFNAFDSEQNVIDNFEHAICDNTGLAVITSVSNVSSRRLPFEKISEICRRRNIKLIIDASQGAGVVPVDIKYADIICAPGHKSLLGPQGTGFLIFSPSCAENVVNMPVLMSGGGGINSLEKEMPEFLPERFESGTLNTVGIAGLCEGIKAVKRIGVPYISEHETHLGNMLRDMLQNSSKYTLYDTDVRYGGTVLFNHRIKGPSELSQELNSRGICVRSGFHCAPLAHKALKTSENGAVRVSFGLYNTVKDCRMLMNVLNRL